MLKNLRNALLLMAVVAIALAVIFNEFLVYAAIFVGAMIIFYGLYYAFLRTKDAEIDQLKSKLNEEEHLLEKVQKENEELRHRKLNLSAIKQILDVGLYEIDTNFTRTWNEEMTTETGKIVQFIGALKVDLIAKYGVDLKEMKVKTIGDEVHIANLNLKSLSFTELDYDWVIAEVLEHKKPYLGSKHRRTNTMLELEANKIKQRLQKRTHEEVKQGPEELNTLTAILKKQLVHSIALLIGVKDEQIKLVENVDGEFETIEEIRRIED